ncbi:MAG: CAP domain-containing protein [Candidatus Komeilibacteria bacterium]|nr:CAP domain-containing protein [Candidatus Komeilibacteria bacterium]
MNFLSPLIWGRNLLFKNKILKKSFSFLLFGFLSIAVMLFFVPASRSQSAGNLTPGELINLTNAARADYSLPPLAANPLLSEEALAKAKLIIKEQKFSHEPDSQKFSSLFKNSDYHYTILGENLAMGFGSNQAIVAAWMNSPAHRDNILNNRYKDIGIAVVRGTLDGEDADIVVQYLGATSNIILSENLLPYQNNFILPAFISCLA